MRLLLFLVLLLPACSQQRMIAKDKSDYKHFPPGTVQLNDTLFIDKAEVSNMGWHEFVSWVYVYDSAHKYDFKTCLPDSSVWEDDYCRDYYFRRFTDRPVVGISYEQALAFCDWRTEMVNTLISSGYGKQRWGFKKVRYRLPTKEEWEYAAADQLNAEQYPYGVESLHDRKKRLTVACNRYDTSEPWEITLPYSIKSLSPNRKGLYHLNGNMSEMVSEKGLAKGGNLWLPLDSCKIRQDHWYDTPQKWLSFRCVCEIVE